MRERLDTCREPVGATLQAIVGHDNAEASPRSRTFHWIRTEYPGAPKRRILLSCVSAAVLLLPAAASGRTVEHAKPRPGYLVVKKASDDGGVNGRPAIILVVRGFVLGRVSAQQEAQIEIYHLPGKGSSQAAGGNKSATAIRWRSLPGTRYSGSGFRFRAIGALYRVVVRSTGVYLFAGGRGNVTLRGSSFDLSGDGKYSLDGAPFRSLPARETQRKLGRG